MLRIKAMREIGRGTRREWSRDEGAGAAGSAPGKRTLTDELAADPSRAAGPSHAGAGSGEGDGGGEGKLDGASRPVPMDTSKSAADVTTEAGYTAKSGKPDRKKVGVGEVVYFTAEADAGTWKASAGKLSTTKGPTADWTAPSTAQSVTVTFDPGGGAAATTVKMEVIAPEIRFTKVADLKGYDAGKMGAGMKCDVNFLPFDVSFAATEWKESDVPGENATGYFEGRPLPKHIANPKWRGFNNDNTGPGDLAEFRDAPAPWDKDGSYDWNIPQNYRVKGETTPYEIKKVMQICNLEGPPHAGRTTVTKDGQSSTRSP